MKIVVALATLLAIGSFSHAAEVWTIAGDGTAASDGDGGPAVDASISGPFGVTIGPDDAIYVCETEGHRIRRIDRETGRISTIAGTGEPGYRGAGGLATAAQINEPYEIRFDDGGDLFFVDRMTHTVRCIDHETGIISTIAGTGKPGFSGDGGPATQARLNYPHSIALDDDGNLYICDIRNHRVRRVDLNSGIITTFAGTGEQKSTPDGAPIKGTPLNGPRALAFDGQDNLVLALREGNAIYRLDLAAGTIHHIAGTGKSGYFGDGGDARKAELAGPKGVALTPETIFFADTESHTIRAIDRKTNIITTIIGDGTRGDGPAGGVRNCRLDRPHGIEATPDGLILVGDTNNHRVRALQIRAD